MPEEWRALSLWQPYASLIAVGAKRVETRSWETSYRGPLLIHAAKRYTQEQHELARDREFGRPLRDAGILFRDQLAFGCIVATARLIAIAPTECFTAGWVPVGTSVRITPQELLYGDYSPGRFGWILTDVKRLSSPVPCRGTQGLWTPEPEDVRIVEAVLAGVGQ